MTKKFVKGVSLVMGLALLGSSFIGCTKKEPATGAGSSTTPTAAAAKEFSYPMEGNVTLKYWMELHANATTYAKNFGELPFAQELMKRTGVKIEYIHPATGQAKEAFSILVASGDLPDIVEYNWLTYPGGITNAVTNGVVLKLNDVWDKHSPNVKKYLAANPEYDKQVKTDDGSYIVYPMIRGDKELQNTSGPIIRKDWLDELNLPVPETMDEWYTMLTAFKDKKGAKSPLTANAPKEGTQINNLFEGAYKIRLNEFMHENNKVKFGPAEPAYKDYLATMAKWYKEGLIDKNFSTTDRKAQDANMLNGTSGATYGAGGGHMGTYLSSMKDKDPKYNLTAAKFPVLKKGDKVQSGLTSVGFSDNGMAAISAKSKNVEAAARLLDYGYSKEGNILYNFGTEGVSYKMENGKPIYTDLIMKNPDKLTFAQALTKYARGNTNGPFVQDKGYLEQFYEQPQQKAALVLWSDHNKASTFMPTVSHTPEESQELARIMTDVNTYVLEMQLKFIMGVEPIDNFGKYTDQLKKMNLDKAIEIKQKALDRYNKR